MAIDYVEIRDENLNIIGYIDTAISVIWHTMYYGTGDFEIYAQATGQNLFLLQADYFVTRPNTLDIGIIEKIQITKNAIDGNVIVATGRFAKAILDRRYIYKISGKQNKATVISGNVETAVRNLVNNNAISCSFDSGRNISILKLGAHTGTTAIITDESGSPANKQISVVNLLEFTDDLLHEYKLGAYVAYDNESNKLEYIVFEGFDRSVANAAITPVVISEDFDNLASSEFTDDISAEKTAALIGGAGEGVEKFYSVIAGTKTGIARKESYIDAAEVERKYIDDGGMEHTYTDAEYKKLLNTFGKTKLAEMIRIESFYGTMNVDYAQYALNVDFMLGDIITIQDNKIGKYANVRIVEVTEIQDANGYAVEASFE